jgi:hypothetical protein
MMPQLATLCALFLFHPSPTAGLQFGLDNLRKIREVGQGAAAQGTPEEYCDADKLVLNQPTGSLNTGDRTLRYPNAKPGVDVLLQASASFKTNKPDKCGKQGNFGNINMAPGTASTFTLTFVSAGTTSPVTMDKVSLSFFDQDEHKEAAARSSIETCQVDASFLAINTELSGAKNGNCYKTVSCEYGNKHNNPNDPNNLLPDQYKRASTFSYSSTSSITVKIGLAGAKGAGRNFQFTLDPVNACLKTTTTTTTKFDGFAPSCPNPTGSWKMCNCRQDPYCDNSFKGQGYWHHGFGVFRQAKTKTGDEIQGFQCPLFRTHKTVGIICGVAVKMGKNVITYIGQNFASGSGSPLMKINGVTQSYGGQHRIAGGVVMPSNANVYTNDKNEVCIYDDAKTLNVQIGLQVSSIFEVNWKLHMADNVIDTTVAAGCNDGASSFDSSSHWAKDRVQLKDSLFSLQEVEFICENAFKVSGMWKSKEHSGGCNFDELEDWKHPVLSNEALCESTGASYADAQKACSGISKQLFLSACLFEYCNDKGEGDVVDVAKKIEEGLVKDEIDEIESHERFFVPKECCDDDPNCDKSISLVTPAPTPAPTPQPTPSPTSYPTPSPTSYPTPSPTPYPTPSPTPSPTPYPTPSPTPYPTPYPTPPPLAIGYGNWWGSFDRAGWNTVPGAMTGIYRNSCNSLYCIEEVQYATTGRGACYHANWWGSFDRKGWSTCNSGYFMNGLYRNHCHSLYCIEEAYCCRQSGYSSYNGGCSHANWWGSFDRKGWSTCPSGQAMAGMYRNSCNSLYCIEEAYCCPYYNR